MPRHWSRPALVLSLVIVGMVLIGASTGPSNAQSQQEVSVIIKDYVFETSQMPLQLHTDTIIRVKNMDKVRHDFGSMMFFNTLTHVDSQGVITYGKGIEGAFIEPGQEASFRLVLEQPGRFEFHCSIHQDMKGEILLLVIDAV